jgi:hypothetical protein
MKDLPVWNETVIVDVWVDEAENALALLCLS